MQKSLGEIVMCSWFTMGKWIRVKVLNEDALSPWIQTLETCSAMEPEQALGVGGWVLKKTIDYSSSSSSSRKECAHGGARLHVEGQRVHNALQ